MHLTAALTGSSTSSAGDQASAGAGDKKRFVCASLPDSQAIIDAGQRVMGEQIFSTNIFRVCMIALRQVRCSAPRAAGCTVSGTPWRKPATTGCIKVGTVQYSTVQKCTVKYSNVEPLQDASRWAGWYSQLPPSS